jgi:ketosteroid isomerase-like protein
MTESEEYRQRGFLAAARALADASVLPELLADEAVFTAELARMEAEGRRGVPYLLTEAIRRVARDAAITGVVEDILGTAEWVMWGPNIRWATPNQADVWHVDLESFLWPTVTVAVGLAGCTPESATWCLAGTQGRRVMPPSTEREVLAEGAAEQMTGFGDGRFYVFDASVWHRGDRETSRERVMLFLHYQRARDRRIPLLVDYYKQLWAPEASPYFPVEGVRREVAALPWRYRWDRWRSGWRG